MVKHFYYRDLEDVLETPKPRIRIENLSSTLKESQDDTPISNDNVHCNCKSYARLQNGQLIKCPKPAIYFNDGVRSVDFIIVWDAFNEDSTTECAYYKRRIFEENLIKDGLDIEYEDPEKNGLNFIKVDM